MTIERQAQAVFHPRPRALSLDGAAQVRTVEAELRALGWTAEDLWGTPAEPWDRYGYGLAYSLNDSHRLGRVTADYAEVICYGPVTAPSVLRRWRAGREPWITRAC